MELGVGGEAEKDVDDVGGQVQGFAPILAKNTRQSAEAGFCKNKYRMKQLQISTNNRKIDKRTILFQLLEVVRIPCHLQDHR